MWFSFKTEMTSQVTNVGIHDLSTLFLAAIFTSLQMKPLNQEIFLSFAEDVLSFVFPTYLTQHRKSFKSQF